MSRKHARSDDYDELYVGERNPLKKFKLDQLFDDLTIDDVPIIPKADKYVINPQVNQFTFKEDKADDINFYISEKLYQKYQEDLQSQYSVIKWYNPKYLLVKHFQDWSIKMFNSFLTKYNQKNHLKIPKVKNYDKLLRLIEGKISTSQLYDIILQENAWLMLKLSKKGLRKKNKLENDHIQLLKNLQYNYWDNIKLDKDWEMSQDAEDGDTDEGERKFVDVSDSEMEIE